MSQQRLVCPSRREEVLQQLGLVFAVKIHPAAGAGQTCFYECGSEVNGYLC